MMSGDHFGILSAIIFTPLIMGILMLMIPKKNEHWARILALLSGLISLGLAGVLWQGFDASSGTGYQFYELRSWIPEWGVHYALGLDGISLPLIMLTAFVTPLGILGTWPMRKDSIKNEKIFYFLFLLLQSGVYGTFLSLDMFLFYFFWEIVLFPMFFLIGIWGGKERLYATVKFVLYTMFGSLLMLAAIIFLIFLHYRQFGAPSALLADLMRVKLNFSGMENGWMAMLSSPQMLVFMAFALAFVIKIPMFPFHTWLPDAHVQAPTLGSVYLAAVLLKMGTYGLMRFAIPLFPQAAHAATPFFYLMGLIGIIYGAFCAIGQTDMKRLVAYSSISHMGYIVVGLFTFQETAIAGSLYQMVNHGISSAGLFMVVGFIYERLHTRNLEELGGLASFLPVVAVSYLIMTLSSVALPGTNGFVGEFNILLGTYQVAPCVSFLAGLGVIFGAVYALKAYQMVMFGPNSKVHAAEYSGLHDLRAVEIISMVVLSVSVFILGIFPQSFFGVFEATLKSYIELLLN